MICFLPSWPLSLLLMLLQSGRWLHFFFFFFFNTLYSLNLLFLLFRILFPHGSLCKRLMYSSAQVSFLQKGLSSLFSLNYPHFPPTVLCPLSSFVSSIFTFLHSTSLWFYMMHIVVYCPSPLAHWFPIW